MIPPFPRLRRRLLAWYRRTRRPLPWRATTDPYRIWVSEIMLQQTTVRTVIPYYERFIKAFPTIRKLAAARLDDVLGRWSGLGYYRRARYLHEAARTIVSRHGGRFPQTLPQALALPGIGDYTAAAVLSIACGKSLPVVDGNVARVLSRWGEISGPVKSAATANRIATLARDLLPASNPGDFNQAMMELGATVCTPRAPRCPECPLSEGCLAFRNGTVDAYPEAQDRPAPRPETMAVAIVERNGSILLRKRTTESLMKGLWEIPSRPAGDASKSSSGAVRQWLKRDVHPGIGDVMEAGTARHAIMNRRIRLVVFRASPGSSRPRIGWVWKPVEQLPSLGCSSMLMKALRVVRADRPGRPKPGPRFS